MEWIEAHISQLIAAAVVIIPTIIQISPIKVNPWSALARSVGRAVNRELFGEFAAVKNELGEMRQELSEHAALDNNRFAKQCRLRVLRFNDEILQGTLHTKEHYDEILDDITSYERHCELNPGYRNSKATMAIQNIEMRYQEHLAAKDFL